MLKEPNFKQDADVRPLQKFELKFLRHLPHGTLPIFCFRKGNQLVSAVGGLLFSALLVEATDDSPLVVRLHLVQRTAEHQLRQPPQHLWLTPGPINKPYRSAPLRSLEILEYNLYRRFKVAPLTLVS